MYKKLIFPAAIVFCTAMALIPGAMDPTQFINDKVKHGLTFFALALMLDRFAFPADRFQWQKAAGLFAFGVLIEVLQDHTGLRKGSTGDLSDIVSNLIGITCYFMVVHIVRHCRQIQPTAEYTER